MYEVTFKLLDEKLNNTRVQGSLNKNLTSNYFALTTLGKALNNPAHNPAPQYLQNFASASCPSAEHCGQAWVLTGRSPVRDIATVMIPVGTAITP
jgi:hypothetical protein